MSKAKIVIPQKGIWRVFRNNLEFDEEYAKKHQKKAEPNHWYYSLSNNVEPLTIFSNPDYHYVMNIPKTVNSVKSTSHEFFNKLNVTGALELNFPCPYDLYLYSSKFKELIINTPEWANSKFHFSYYSGSETNSNSKTLNNVEKITLSGGPTNIHLNNLVNLKELTINCKKINSIFLDLINLKKINFPLLEKITLSNLSNKYCNPFPSYGYNGSLHNQIPDSALITINKNCLFSSEEGFSSVCPIEKNYNQFKTPDIPLKDFINKSTAKTYVENNDGTFTVRFSEFKLLLKNEVIKKYENQIKLIREAYKTESAIVTTMNESLSKSTAKLQEKANKIK